MQTTRLIASFASVVALVGLCAAADSTAVPRYKFEPGLELTYRSTSTMKYGEKDDPREHGNKSDWTIWVVRANPDGSFRLILNKTDSSFSTVKGEKHESPARTQLVYADVFPDGRVLPNETIKYQGHPGAIFPKLPKDAAEAATGWSWERDGDKINAKPVKADAGFRFETVTDSPFNVIYLSSNSSVYTFDPAQGRILAIESKGTQGYGFKGENKGTTELVSAKATDAAVQKQLASEEAAYFDSIAAYGKVSEEVGKTTPEVAKKKLQEAIEAFQGANKNVSHPGLKADLEARVKRHEQTAKYTLDDVERRTKVVGKAAEAFSTTDIDGKAVKLEDLKGQVVVLDFWYRGCGWCIKAMPQMNQLADDFKGQPVQIFGMNTDRVEEDAKFVIEKMGLKYPTLKATGLPEKFGVQGFPTLIVIDKEGKVHDLHVGYTPTLREDVGKQIKALLERK